jgi:uncharacterized protein YbjT (DUF2867 family)
MSNYPAHTQQPTLVLGGTGKTGSRLVQRLTRMDLPVRVGSRSAGVPFDWDKPATWAPALEGVGAVYISVYPDFNAPGALEKVSSFAEQAVASGVQRQVLLSGRGEPEAQQGEKAVAATGADLTVLRCAWFSQNFSENYLLDLILAGEVALPAGDVGEPFLDAEDIADVAATVLTQDGHAGKLYELTGPRLLTFADAVAAIADATGRDITYTQMDVAGFSAYMKAAGVSEADIEVLNYVFTTTLDGHNAYLADGVRQVLGRAPRDFADFARATAATGYWDPQ